MDDFLMTLEELSEIQPGEIFRTVITKNHLDTVRGNVELKFVCIKGDHGGANDWTIYYEQSYEDATNIAQFGTKLMDKTRILRINPCTIDVMKQYRF
jgi:hypothetical protein